MKQFFIDLASRLARRTRSYFNSHGSEKIFPFSYFALLIFFANTLTAEAVPGYARQTGMSCTACHSYFPQLNAFGRQFKLSGYTLSTIGSIEEKNENGNLKLLTTPPLSVMAQASFSHLKEIIPETQNDNVELPQQLSLFLSGQIAPKLGSFIQLTYDQQGAVIGIDNVDIRYANRTPFLSKNLFYGFTLNNNPTVQDLWNSTPAWGYPYASSPVAPSPMASTMLEGSLSQQVAGLGAYGLFNNLLYAEFSIYRSAQQGAPDPPGTDSEMIIRGIAPYWRLALQHQWERSYIEAGTLGMSSNLYPKGISGLTDMYTDIGFDLQFEHSLSKANLILHSLWIREMQKLDASIESGSAQNNKNTLNSFKIDASIYFDKGFGFTAAYYNTTGSQDDSIYSTSPITGSVTGKPDSNGFIFQANFMPWNNAQFTLQYVMNNKFNGTKINYDSSGRNASSNNCLYILSWINF